MFILTPVILLVIFAANKELLKDTSMTMLVTDTVMFATLLEAILLIPMTLIVTGIATFVVQSERRGHTFMMTIQTKLVMRVAMFAL
jgi:hypothetical protein